MVETQFCLNYYQQKLGHNLLSNSSARRGKEIVRKREIGERRKEMRAKERSKQ
jgi:hypothetical protein